MEGAAFFSVGRSSKILVLAARPRSRNSGVRAERERAERRRSASSGLPGV